MTNESDDTLQLLIDGPGVLKFSDFELARAEGENLDELFDTFVESAEGDTNDERTTYETNGKFSTFTLQFKKINFTTVSK